MNKHTHSIEASKDDPRDAMKRISVLFFATLKDRVGTSAITLEITPNTKVRDLKDILKKRFPALNPSIETALVSINREYAFDDDLVPENAEVAIFPPVSGGIMVDPPTYLDITENELDMDEVLSRIVLPTTGAVCIFTGIVRGITHRGETYETDYLEYEAYKPMAISKLSQVVDEIRNKYPSVEGIAIVQRIGHLHRGVPTVIVACSAAHRDTGVFEATRYGIDRLKEVVPIWKKEGGSKGEAWVEGNYRPTEEDLYKKDFHTKQ